MENGFIPKNIEFIDSDNYVKRSIAILKQVGNLRLVGESGVGKTTLVYKLAEDLNVPLFEMVLTRDVSRWDLLACETLRKGETTIRDGIILLWLKSKKGILYLDGFNYAEANIISLIESLSDFRGNVWIPELQKSFKRSEQHYIVISFNPSEQAGYTGTYATNIATMRRFEGLIVDYLPMTKETSLINKIAGDYEFSRRIVELANKTRILYREGSLRTPLTTGNLLNYAKLYKYENLDFNDLMEIICSLYTVNEQKTIRELIETVKKQQIEEALEVLKKKGEKKK